MTYYCCRKLITILKETGEIYNERQRVTKPTLISPEGIILAVIIHHDGLIMKDIPYLTGISFRSCFSVIEKLSALGVIEKLTRQEDRRAITFKINQSKLCDVFCHNRSFYQAQTALV
jgi:hypothetical protein